MGARHRGDLVSTYGPPGEMSLGDVQTIHQAAEVFGQRGGVIRLLRIGPAVPPPIVGKDSEAISKGGRKIVEDVRVTEAAVDKDQHRTRATPIEVVESDAVGGDEAAFVGGSIGPDGRLPACGQGQERERDACCWNNGAYQESENIGGLHWRPL
jgi:hypothetical protein